MKIRGWHGRYWYLSRQKSQLQIIETEGEKEFIGRIGEFKESTENAPTLQNRHEPRNEKQLKLHKSYSFMT